MNQAARAAATTSAPTQKGAVLEAGETVGRRKAGRLSLEGSVGEGVYLAYRWAGRLSSLGNIGQGPAQPLPQSGDDRDGGPAASLSWHAEWGLGLWAQGRGVSPSPRPPRPRALGSRLTFSSYLLLRLVPPFDPLLPPRVPRNAGDSPAPSPPPQAPSPPGNAHC